MTSANVERLRFLVKVAGKETEYLLGTTKRLSQENIK
mgnify:CR=1 FL=1